MVKGYFQQLGVDFNQTFVVVVKPMAFRVLFAIAAYFDLDIDQMDVKTAFLYGLINQLIYIKISKGTKTKVNKNIVCKLLKVLYGLKQSPRLWYEKLFAFLLEKLGLRRTHANYNIFLNKVGRNSPIVSIFINDIKIMGTKESGFIGRVKAETHRYILDDRNRPYQFLSRIEGDTKSREENNQIITTYLYQQGS